MIDSERCASSNRDRFLRYIANIDHVSEPKPPNFCYLFLISICVNVTQRQNYISVCHCLENIPGLV